MALASDASTLSGVCGALPEAVARQTACLVFASYMVDSIVTIASLLKDQGYTTGQFGKNHLGDLNKHLPTVHGFDEFFGNLYHLNAEEEPEMANYPKDPKFREIM